MTCNQTTNEGCGSKNSAPFIKIIPILENHSNIRLPGDGLLIIVDQLDIHISM